MYYKRQLEQTINKIEKMFGAVLISGSRQVGKTTLLREMKPGTTYLTLDDPILLNSAIEDTGAFFKATPPPVIVDEVQYAPNLFPYIKMILDENKKKGQFFLTGSQQFKMMKNVSETLVGRMGILTLMGLSLREINRLEFNLPFLPSSDYLANRKKNLVANDYNQIWQIIHRGSMPAMHIEPVMDWQAFYAAYTKTYIERDVRDLTQVGDGNRFIKFMTAIASRTGQLLNQAAVSRDVGVSQPTVERWLSILQASSLIYMLQPFHNNLISLCV